MGDPVLTKTSIDPDMPRISFDEMEVLIRMTVPNNGDLFIKKQEFHNTRHCVAIQSLIARGWIRDYKPRPGVEDRQILTFDRGIHNWLAGCLVNIDGHDFIWSYEGISTPRNHK